MDDVLGRELGRELRREFRRELWRELRRELGREIGRKGFKGIAHFELEEPCSCRGLF